MQCGLRHHALQSLPDSLRVFGGFDLETVFNDVQLFSFVNKTWCTLNTANAPSPRFQHTAVLIEGGLYVFGGNLASRSSLFASAQDVTLNLTSELWMLNTTTLVWVQLGASQPDTPPPLTAHTMTAVGSAFYIIGGRSAAPGFSASVFVFSTTTQRWSQLPVLIIENLDVCRRMQYRCKFTRRADFRSLGGLPRADPLHPGLWRLLRAAQHRRQQPHQQCLHRRISAGWMSESHSCSC